MFVFGKQYGASVSKIFPNDSHKNIAYLIILARTEDVTVIDESGKQHTGRALLIKPMTEHKVKKSENEACHIFLAPQSRFAISLSQFANDDGIVTLSKGDLPFNSEMPSKQIFNILDEILEQSNDQIDARLAAALDHVTIAPSKSTVTELAKLVDLSPSRLRTLAKEQIGVSFSTLILWRKLIVSLEALASGMKVSEAAQAGGFADQAHFARTTRKMLGITPTNSTYTLD